tara:strand:- start:319 stop:927 length:609 start_codon:yes stop_codon:yes gene_type:complete
MNKDIFYTLGFFLILYVIFNIEGFVNTYEPNKVLSDEPDDIQYYACRQDISTGNPEYPFQKYPNSNYRVKRNNVDKPLKGTFSAFLDTNKIRTYEHFYHSPICEDDNESYDFNTNIDSAFRLIPGAFPEEDINKIYRVEREKDSHDLRNPFYTLGNPEYLENKILYEDDIQDMFLKVKLRQPLHHEDDRHLVNDHQYDGTHD